MLSVSLFAIFFSILHWLRFSFFVTPNLRHIVIFFYLSVSLFSNICVISIGKQLPEFDLISFFSPIFLNWYFRINLYIQILICIHIHTFFLFRSKMFYCHLGFPGGSVIKDLSANAGDTRDVGSWLGKIPGGGNGHPLQYSCLDNPMDRSRVDYSPWGNKELDMMSTHSYIL